ncbi:DUF3305 domain-containing protein [Limnobacter humi]|uniref:DUF3305 domain-containing protein n=1 Tax=Limnobacter humi TaxID=1778671 RepID=A0ABT1WEE5_9BURK|nr:DUF3305 domain-containing protein [Limnobacter humi]MCQ8895903.1 DUF3305 domain-containing protein [Limnobacter humi]
MSANFLALGEFRLLVKMARIAQQSVWQPYRWQASSMFPAESAPVVSGPDEQWCPVSVRVYQDELQGYFLNLDTDQPFVFFMVRYPDDNRLSCPTVEEATLSYDEAARWMDSNEEVQTLPMPEGVRSWLSELVAERYKPEPKQRKRPRSFVAPEKREG